MGMKEPAELLKGKRRNKRQSSESCKNREGLEGTSPPIVDKEENGVPLGSKKLKKTRKYRIRSVNSELDNNGAASKSLEVDSKEHVESSKGEWRKKRKSSESCMDIDSSTSLADTQKKKKKKKKKKENKVEKTEGRIRTLSDVKTKKKCQEEKNLDSKEKLRKTKKSKTGVSEDANATPPDGGNSGSVGVDLGNQKSSTVVAGVKKSQNKRKSEDRINEKQKPMSIPDGNSSKLSDSKKKRVSFSGRDEVFTLTSDESNLVRGKRFSKEEDEMIKKAVLDYIKENNLGEDGLQKVLRSQSHPEVRCCWKEIGAALPWRPKESICHRAHILFQRSEKRKWELEELDLVRRYHEEHGAKWSQMGEILGKHRHHVKDAWRRSLKLANPKRGKWTLEEYQSLFDLVNADLQLKAFEERKTKHGMLRENISWGTISEKMTTRFEMNCCMKWYQQLTSPMVSQGLWADTDDYLLIDGLLKLDACCLEDVEWDHLLEHRSGEISLRRWKQMTRYIGGPQERSFMEQVEILSSRYCPNMLEYRANNVRKSAVESDGCKT